MASTIIYAGCSEFYCSVTNVSNPPSNSKYEIRSTKQIRNTNVQMFQTLLTLLQYGTENIHQFSSFNDQNVSIFFLFLIVTSVDQP
jgi:hypothetical protein